MAIKVPVHLIPAEPHTPYRNEYTDSLQNMFQEAIRVHANLGTLERWPTTDYTGPFSELKAGFLAYKA